jgi:hypothetical protein
MRGPLPVAEHASGVRHAADGERVRGDEDFSIPVPIDARLRSSAGRSISALDRGDYDSDKRFDVISPLARLRVIAA